MLKSISVPCVNSSNVFVGFGSVDYCQLTDLAREFEISKGLVPRDRVLLLPPGALVNAPIIPMYDPSTKYLVLNTLTNSWDILDIPELLADDQSEEEVIDDMLDSMAGEGE